MRFLCEDLSCSRQWGDRPALQPFSCTLKFPQSLNVQKEHFQWANLAETCGDAVWGTYSIFYQFSALSVKRHQSCEFFPRRHKKYVRRRQMLSLFCRLVLINVFYKIIVSYNFMGEQLSSLESSDLEKAKLKIFVGVLYDIRHFY